MRYLLTSLVCLLAFTFTARSAEGLTPSNSEREAAESTALRLLKDVAPLPPGASTSGKVHAGATYILHGHLFGGKTQWAIVDLGSGIAAAKRKKDQWVFAGTWKIPTLWKKPGFSADELAALPDKAPSQPFWLSQLWKDLPPFLVIATEHDRYGHGHFVLRCDASDQQIPDDCWFTVNVPEARGDYLCLTNYSPRKAWWSEKSFYRRRGDKFFFAARWRDECENPERTFWEVEIPSPDPKARTEYRVRAVDNGYDLSRDEKKIGSAAVTWTGPNGPKLEQGAEELLLFERLTGLPASVYGTDINHSDPAKIKASHKYLRLTVTGTSEARALLSGKARSSPKKEK